MKTISKTFDSKADAKKALHDIFGPGPYQWNGHYAETRFLAGEVKDNVVTLRSDYWEESSLKRAFEVGVDGL